MSVASNCKATAVVTAGYGSPYLRTADAAAYLGLGKSTLERLRWSGGGPKFRVLGARVVTYAVPDLDDWASQRVRLSTSEAA